MNTRKEYDQVITEIFDLMERRDKMPKTTPKVLIESLMNRQSIASKDRRKEIEKEMLRKYVI